MAEFRTGKKSYSEEQVLRAWRELQDRYFSKGQVTAFDPNFLGSALTYELDEDVSVAPALAWQLPDACERWRREGVVARLDEPVEDVLLLTDMTGGPWYRVSKPPPYSSS